MKFFRTEDAVSFHYGTILGLTEKQAKPRIQVKTLETLGDGKFKVIDAVQFKIGEVIGLDDKDIPKAYLPKLTVITEKEGKSPVESPDTKESAPAGERSTPFGEVDLKKIRKPKKK